MTSIPQLWDSSIVPTLVDYIRIPAKSPHFDRDWAKNGLRGLVGGVPAAIPGSMGRASP